MDKEQQERRELAVQATNITARIVLISDERICQLFNLRDEAPDEVRAGWCRWVRTHPDQAGATWPAAAIAYKKHRDELAAERRENIAER